MTIKKLNQYRSIRREIAEINIQLEKTNAHESVVGSDKEYPYTQHVMSVNGVIHSRETAILMRRLRECLRCKEMAEAFIYGIEDSITRRIFILRYIDGEIRPSWVRVAHMIGGGNTTESIRQAVSRYMKNNS